jgi:hypothetical protein
MRRRQGAAFIIVWALSACSAQPTLQGEGGRCFQVADCKPGLVCVPQSNQARICSGDLSSLVPEGGVSDATTPAQVPDGQGAEVVVSSSADSAIDETGIDARQDAPAQDAATLDAAPADSSGG